MRNRYVLAAILIIIFILFAAGSLLSENCVNVGGCKSCWRTTEVVVQSDLCGENSSCLAQPADQQNNAIVDAVLCACSKAKAANYADTATNNEIQDVVNAFARYNLSASEICEQPGLFLAKRSYT